MHDKWFVNGFILPIKKILFPLQYAFIFGYAQTLTRVSEKFAFLAYLKLNLFVHSFTGQFWHVLKKNEKWLVHSIEVIEKLRVFELNNGNLKSVNTCYDSVLLKIIAFTLQLKGQMIANDFSGQLQLNELSSLSKNNWVIAVKMANVSNECYAFIPWYD